MLEVGVLGAVHASLAGTEISLGGPRQRQVLAHLAMAQGRAVSADALIDDLWLDPPRDPAHALQAHVSRLRSVLPIEITRTAAGYLVDPSQLIVDAYVFENEHAAAQTLLVNGDAVLAGETLRRALARWRGPAFDGLDTRALQPDAARLERLRVTAEGDRIEADLAAGHVAEAIADLYELVEREPLVERHWVQLMTALHIDGHVSEALTIYRRARDVYVELLGSEPSAAIQDVHHSLLRGEDATPLRPTPLTGGESPRPRRRQIVGRRHEMEHLDLAWKQSRDGLRIVTISGEAGIGKTRLATEFAASLTTREAQVLTGRCDEFLDVALQPFVDMVRADSVGRSTVDLAARLGPHAEDLSRLVPELTARLGLTFSPRRFVDPNLERYQLMEAIGGWLSTSARSGPLCLVIDDVQWADAETAATFEHLLRSSADVPLLVVLIYRDRESRDSDPRLDRLIQQSELLSHLPLTGLNEQEVGELIGEEIRSWNGPDQPQPVDLATRIRDSSGGNPLFALELTRQVVSAAGAGDTGLPSGLLDVIRRRAAQLPDTIHAALQVAAVIGREFEPATLAQVTGLTSSELDEALHAGLFHRLIEQYQSVPLRFRFCHDAVRAALYDECGPIRRAELHRRIAETIEQRPPHRGEESHHVALGHHFAHAATVYPDGRAAQHLQIAARLSSQRRAYQVAADLYRQAEAVLPPEATFIEHCDLTIARGTAQFHAGDPEFRATLLEAARAAADHNYVDGLVRAVVANHRGWYSSANEIDHDRVELIELAMRRCPDDDLRASAHLHAMWAMENVREPRQRERALERSAIAAEIAEKVGDPGLLIDILCDRFSVLYATFEDPPGCVELALRIEELARQSDDQGHLLNAEIAVAQSTMMTGDFATSDAALASSEKLAERLHRPVRLWLAQVWIATRTAMRGDLDRAEELASEALELGLSLDQPDAFSWYAGQLFSLRFLADRTPELLEAIEAQVADHSVTVPSWQAGLAYTLATVGRHDEAGRIVDEFIERDFTNLPHDMLRLQGLSHLASACVRLADADRARAVYAELVPYTSMLAHNGTIDAGPIDLHLGGLAATFGDRDAARHHLTEAAELCRRIDAPAWGQHVDRALAALELHAV